MEGEHEREVWTTTACAWSVHEGQEQIKKQQETTKNITENQLCKTAALFFYKNEANTIQQSMPGDY